jgi:hypothetical protein
VIFDLWSKKISVTRVDLTGIGNGLSTKSTFFEIHDLGWHVADHNMVTNGRHAIQNYGQVLLATVLSTKKHIGIRP